MSVIKDTVENIKNFGRILLRHELAIEAFFFRKILIWDASI